MERPILFSTPMVQAILNGRKTQTRRIVKPQPESIDHAHHKIIPYNGSVEFLHNSLKCPYGKVGDVLWVRETYTKLLPEHFITSLYVYKADCDLGGEEARQDYIKAGYPYQWKPSIFMPKEACRIRLEITDIRVERLQDISKEDAIAEGIDVKMNGIHPNYRDYKYSDSWLSNPYWSYNTLWEKINGNGSWEKNPWVWAITFEKI